MTAVIERLQHALLYPAQMLAAIKPHSGNMVLTSPGRLGPGSTFLISRVARSAGLIRFRNCRSQFPST